MISESSGSNKPWLERPKLRPVELVPVQGRSPEEKAVALRDPERLAPKPVVLSLAAVAILQHMDGLHDLRDIQTVLFKAFGEMVELDAIHGLMNVLDENMFIEGETFERFLHQERQAFAAMTIRPSRLAGQAYAADGDALSKDLLDYYHAPEGPGALESHSPDTAGAVKGLVAPHIDFQRGGPCYAWAYRELDPSLPPDLMVILGTAHCATERLLSILDKDLATPFGPAVCHRELAGELLSRHPSYKDDEFVHRGEHSIEFQAVWSKSRLGRDTSTRFLPVLCGSLAPFIEDGATASWRDEYEESLSVLKTTLDKELVQGRRVMIVASADLSHVGAQFGDGFQVTKSVSRDVREYDLGLLDEAVAGRADAFLQYVFDRNDRTHVCGISPIYTLLRLLDEPQGRMLSYQQWIDDDKQGMVTFSSMAFP
jgi:AmmeMemoRadiSam system protein B